MKIGIFLLVLSGALGHTIYTNVDMSDLYFFVISILIVCACFVYGLWRIRKHYSLKKENENETN